MSERWYVLMINPEPWAIGPVGYSRRGGKMSAYVGRNAQLDAYKEAVREEIADQNPEKMIGYVDITFWFWRNRATYLTQKAVQHRKHEADATNMLKATEDALQGILYDNDKDNRTVKAVVMAQDAGIHPRIVVRVRQHQPVDMTYFPDEVVMKMMRGMLDVQPSSQEWTGD